MKGLIFPKNMNIFLKITNDNYTRTLLAWLKFYSFTLISLVYI